MYEMQILQNQVTLGKKLDALTGALQEVLKMVLDLSKILAAVAQAQAADASAVQTITNQQKEIASLQQQVTTLTAQLGDQAAAQTQLDAATAQLATSTQTLTAAIPAPAPAAS